MSDFHHIRIASHVRLPSGEAIDLTGARVRPLENIVAGIRSTPVEVTFANRETVIYHDADASALRAWLAGCEELRTQEHIAAVTLLTTAPDGTRVRVLTTKGETTEVAIVRRKGGYHGDFNEALTDDGDTWITFDHVAEASRV